MGFVGAEVRHSLDSVLVASYSDDGIASKYLVLHFRVVSMHYREAGALVLFGTSRQNSLLATGSGILLGVSVWLLDPILGVEYWLWPSSLVDWAVVAGSVLLVAGVTFDRAGLLAACWVNFPAHVAFAHHHYSQTGFVVLPFQNDLLSYALISAQIAVFYGLLGYLLGTASRWGTTGN